MNYIEKEIKILDIDVQALVQKLQNLSAQEVFNGTRIITHFDYSDGLLTQERKTIKLTEEGKLKLTYDGQLESGESESIKFTVSRKEEAMEFLKRLDLYPVAQCMSTRISYEWEGIDFDIDVFPQIPAFIEIDLGESKYSLEDVITKLNLKDKEIVTLSTPEIYTKYTLNYFDIFKI